jgi:hypothetical protein
MRQGIRSELVSGKAQITEKEIAEMSRQSTARFTQGTNLKSTRSNVQEDPVRTERGSGRGKTGGMPGYIETAQDKSSAGLANPSKARGQQNAGPRREGYIPDRKGEPRASWQSAKVATRGSQDESYYKTSTDRPGRIRRLGEPKAPAKRSESEMETTPGGNRGNRNAVSEGGTKTGNRLPPGGAGRFADHIPDTGRGKPKGGEGSARASGQNAAARGGFKTDGRMASHTGNRAPPTAMGFIGGGRGTMESLRGRGNISDNMGMGKPRKGSQMY